MRVATLVWLCALLLLPACDTASQPRLLDPAEADQLIIYSTTDTDVFAPVISDFEALYPHVRIRFVELEAAQLNTRFLAEERSGRVGADIVFSAAMDMQVKLVNDGRAARHMSPNVDALPRWAQWRREAFGLTFEPVVMLYNPRLLGGRRVPQSRAELAEALAADPAFWQRRIGTYDIATSSVGYLLATQDARQSSEFGALAKIMGSRSVRVYAKTSDLIAAIEAGKIVLGYNVLGSYAKRRIAAGDRLKIVYPQDYTLAIIRTAFIPKRAPHPRAAHTFLEYLLSLRGQQVLSRNSFLSPAREGPGGPDGRLAITGTAVGPLRPIPLGPGLMTYLDRQKKQRFLANWRAMIGTGTEVSPDKPAMSAP